MEEHNKFVWINSMENYYSVWEHYIENVTFSLSKSVYNIDWKAPQLGIDNECNCKSMTTFHFSDIRWY